VRGSGQLKGIFVRSWNALQGNAGGLCPGIFLVSLLFIHTSLNAQWLPDWRSEEYVQQGIEQVYNYELDAARASFRKVVDRHPDHPGGHFFVAMVDWMNILVNMEDDSLDDKFFEQLEKVIELSDNILKRRSHDISALFFKGGAIGFRGRLRAHRGQWVRAANDGRRALPVVRRAEQLSPDNADILLGTGIYNYYASVIPEMFPWVRPFLIFFPSGDKEEGLEQLRAASRDARYAGIEASYFLMQILYFNEKKYREAFELAERLHGQFPDNPLFQRYYGRSCVALGRWDEAYKTFLSVAERFEEGRKGYSVSSVREAHYYIAQYLFNNNHLNDALEHYTSVLEYSNKIDHDMQSGFTVLATLRTGMLYDALGEREKALDYYRQVRSMDDYQGSRALAERYTRTPYRRGGIIREIKPNIPSP
jgi:tetratricopeptide (TPR) repeat protein